MLIGLVLSVVIWEVAALIGVAQISSDEMISCCAGGITAGLVLLAVTLPAQLKYGAEKGRIVIIALAAIVVAGGMAVSRLGDRAKVSTLLKDILRWADQFGDKTVLGIVAMTWILVCAVSVWIAEKIIEKREF